VIHQHGFIIAGRVLPCARRAVTHFENQLEVNEAIGDDDGITTAKRNIALARSKYEGDNTVELLNANQELYELRVGDEYTIDR